MTPEREQELNELYADIVDVFDIPNKSAIDKLTMVGQMLWDNEVYGCTDPNASNYCNTCIISTDTCIYTAPPGGDD